MHINDLELFPVAVRHGGTTATRRSLLVRLTTDAGTSGWGEADLGWRAAEAQARREALLSILAGRSIFDVEEIQLLEISCPTPLRCALEMACWDLIGRLTGQPLCHLLGGTYRPQIPMAIRLNDSFAPRQPRPGQTAQLAREMADQGFHCQVVAASGQVEHDLQTLRAIRESVGDRVELRLDGGGVFDLETARELGSHLDAVGLQFFLDPLGGEELYPVASLGRQLGVPLAVWRPIHGPADVLALVRSGAAPQVVIDLHQVGGIGPARKCVAIAEAGGVGATLGGRPSLGVATAAALQLAAATATLSGSNETAYHLLRDDVLTEPLEVVDGMISVPQGPGLGVEVDREKVERLRSE